MHLRTIFNERDTNGLLKRVDQLEPNARAHWGRMNAHQAVCHLNDSLKAILGDRPLAPRRVGVRRKIVRFVGFTLPFRWPKGKIRTSSENDQLKGGTPPAAFASDVAELHSLIARVIVAHRVGITQHYAWGELKPSVLGRYVFRHVDHHLRQFGR
jgi:hypothetical protein